MQLTRFPVRPSVGTGAAPPVGEKPATSPSPATTTTTPAQAPLPSAADFASRGTPSPSSQRLFNLRMQELAGPRPVDGPAFVERALVDIGQRTARGEKVRVVFDLDNTLFDSRQRTLHAARSFDALHGTHHFDHAKLEDMGRDGRDTATRLGLPANVAGEFQKHWDVEFWSDAALRHDTPMAPMVELARRAAAAGAEVVYLTGRIEELRGGSRQQLVRAGLPGADDAHLFLKPDLSHRTGPYKVDQMSKWQDEGFHISWFVTEGRRDIAAVQAAGRDIPCLMLATTHEDPKHAVRADTPTLPAYM